MDDLTHRLKQQDPEMAPFPVGECPKCHAVGPFAFVPTIPTICYCIACHNASRPLQIMGYVSGLDLEELDLVGEL
jgi:hypothetical protein